jgi:hypothetical protein
MVDCNQNLISPKILEDIQLTDLIFTTQLKQTGDSDDTKNEAEEKQKGQQRTKQRM